MRYNFRFPLSVMIAMMLFALGGWPFLAAYLIGAITFGEIIARIKGTSLLKQGSGSAGATNAERVLGKKWGRITKVLDMGKGAAVYFLAVYYWHLSGSVVYAMGFAAALGHMYSVFLKGYGGKSVAVSCGFCLSAQPLLTAGVFALYLIVQLITKTVSISTISGMSTLVVLSTISCCLRCDSGWYMPAINWQLLKHSQR